MIFSLLLFCLLALPGSAWDMSFEKHPDDLEPDEYFSTEYVQTAYGNGSIVVSDHGYAWREPPIGNLVTYRTIYIENDFDGQIAFSTQYGGVSAYTPSYGLILYDSENNVVFQDKDMVPAPKHTGSDYSPWHRIEFVETSSGQGIDAFLDGVLKDSSTYIATPNGSVSKIGITVRATYGGGNTIYDDITTSSTTAIIACDEDFIQDDICQYFRVGYPVVSGLNWYAYLYSPDGIVLNSVNITGQNEFSFPSSDITEDGTYTIRLYAESELGNKFFYASKSFVYNKPSENSILLDKDEYRPGNQMLIFTWIPNFVDGYKVSLQYNTGAGWKSYEYDVTDDDYSKYFTIPSDAKAGKYYAYLITPRNEVVASDFYFVNAPSGDTSITLDKTVYENTDAVKIYYKYLPDDSDITLQLRSGSTNIFTESWRDLSGSGVISFDIEGRAADSVYVQAVTPVPKGTDIILADITAEILSGNGFVSGKVYDSITATPVSGATITIGSSSTVSDAVGYYELSTFLGTQPVSITKDGYQNYTGSMQVYDFAFSKLFYIVPTVSTGSNTLYGTVEDYYTGDPLTGTYIKIKNGSTVYTMLTHSRTGNYLFDQEELSGSWDVTVTKTGYDTHTRTVTIDGDTYLSIKLVPVGGSSSAPDDDSSGSGSGSSGGSSSSADRPSREAAKESLTWLEATMPNLIKLAVVVFMLALIGWRF